MRVSQFEIQRAVQRALEASGAPYGVDRDGASCVAWLEARGLPGLRRLAEDLPGLAGSFGGLALTESADGLEVDAGGISAIAYGVAVADLLRIGRHRNGPASLAIHRCRSPLFLIFALLCLAESDRSASLRWRLPDGRESSCRAGPGGLIGLHAGAGLDPLGGLGAAGPAEAELLPFVLEDPGTATLEAAELERRYQRALDRGVEVEEESWRVVNEFAARVQVPASAESRLKGAGGGDANL